MGAPIEVEARLILDEWQRSIEQALLPSLATLEPDGLIRMRTDQMFARLLAVKSLPSQLDNSGIAGRKTYGV